MYHQHQQGSLQSVVGYATWLWLTALSVLNHKPYRPVSWAQYTWKWKPTSYFKLHLLLHYPLPLDANIMPVRGEEFVKVTSECNIFTLVSDLNKPLLTYSYPSVDRWDWFELVLKNLYQIPMHKNVIFSY